jgi:predicted nuclease of restriction endonuclease-like (RecB) superfamily
MQKTRQAPLYQRIRQILESARKSVARSVNTTQVVANWLIGREIVEEEQRGKKRAAYGEQLLQDLSSRLTAEFGKGFSVDNLGFFRRFFLEYSSLLVGVKSNALRQILPNPQISAAVRQKSQKVNLLPGSSQKGHALRNQSASTIASVTSDILYAPHRESWKPGQLHPNLSWTHYRTLLRVDKPDARAFYEIEALKNNWSARELERQKNSLLYERLALSKDKKGLMQLATKGHDVQQPADVFKDPVVIEFLGIPESPRLVETDLEQALINNLQAFLLELGKGFAFVARQESG